MPSRRRYDSAAVLPFVNVAGDAETEYLSDGIAEEVVNDLSQLRNVRVMAWTTVARYSQRQIDVRAVGRDLGVKAVLSGRLMRQGSHIVLNTELIDVRSGSQLWGKQYERAVSDIPALREQLSEDIAGNLRVRLSGDEQQRIQRVYNPSPVAGRFTLKG